MKLLVPPCVAAIRFCNKNVDPTAPVPSSVVNETACLAAYTACNTMSEIPYELTGKNPYDMKIPCEHGRLCYDFDMITTYLNTPAIQKQLGVSKKWGSGNMAVDLLFVSAGDWMI